MPRNVAGFDQLPKKLRWLEPILEQWIKMNCAYASAFDGKDALYWYNERPNIGALAAAAWRADMYAVEEYVAMKKHHPVTKKKSGRIDLYLADDAGNEAVLEGKQCWLAPSSKTITLKAKMASAVLDAKRDEDHGDQKIAIVFYVVNIDADNVSESALKNQIERVRSALPDAVLAWCFPQATRELKSDKYPNGVYPGLIMAFKLV